MEVGGGIELNFNVWTLICENLSPKDLFNLILVNKSLNRLIGADEIWSRVVHSRWFEFEDEDKFRGITNYFNYFRDCSNFEKEKEKKFEKLITSINSIDIDQSLILKCYAEDILQSSQFPVIPLFRKLRHRKDSLKRSFIAKLLLQAMRINQLLDYLKSTSLEMDLSEEHLFQVSRVDPAFDELLPYRRKFFDAVHAKLRQHPSFGTTTNFSEKVQIISNIVYQHTLEIRCVNFENIHNEIPSARNHLSQNNRMSYLEMCTESSSIMRFYAGEVPGLIAIRGAVIKKIASEYGLVHLRIAERMLRLEEPGQQVMILLHNNIYSRRFSRTLPITLDNLFASHSSHEEHIKYISDPLKLYHVLRLFIPLPSGSAKSSLGQELLLGDIYAKFFPISKEPFLDSFYSKICECFVKQFPEVAIKQYFSYLNAVRTLSSNPFLSSPFKEKEIGEREFSEFIDQTLKSLIKKYRYIPNPIGFPNWINVGQIVRHKRKPYYGVVITCISDDDEFYCILFPNPVSHVQLNNLEIVGAADIQKAIELITRDGNIGRFFDRFDEKTMRFVK